MVTPDEANEAGRTASAIAAFQLSQFAFAALVKNGIVPKTEAEKMLKQAIAANRTGGPGNLAAAELLAVVLQNLSQFQPPPRQ
jgi:hypothetical protein